MVERRFRATLCSRLRRCCIALLARFTRATLRGTLTITAREGVFARLVLARRLAAITVPVAITIAIPVPGTITVPITTARTIPIIVPVAGTITVSLALGLAIVVLRLDFLTLHAARATPTIHGAIGREFIILAPVGGLITWLIPTNTLFILACLGVGNHAEIVVSKLQVILGLDTITVERCVMCQLLVLLEQLRGITPGSAIDPVKLAAALRTIVATTSAAVIAAIVVQRNVHPHL